MQMSRTQTILALAGAATLVMTCPGPAGAVTGSTKIGNAAVVVNAVAGVDPTQRIVQLNAGNEVFVNEVINTGTKSASRMQFLDKTSIAIGADSQVVLDKFVYDPDPSKAAAVITVTRGVIRFATGTMAHAAYTLKTPTATIGVRGTIFNVLVARDGKTTVSVDSGGVVIRAQGREVLVEPGYFATVQQDSPPSPPAPLSEPPPQVAEMSSLLDAAAGGNNPPSVKALVLLRNIPGLAGKTSLRELLATGSLTVTDVVARAVALINQLEQSNVGADPVALQTAADLILQTAANILANLPGLASEQRKNAEAQIEAAIADLLSRIATAAGPQDIPGGPNDATQPVPNPVLSASAN